MTKRLGTSGRLPSLLLAALAVVYVLIAIVQPEAAAGLWAPFMLVSAALTVHNLVSRGDRGR